MGSYSFHILRRLDDNGGARTVVPTDITISREREVMGFANVLSTDAGGSMIVRIMFAIDCQVVLRPFVFTVWAQQQICSFSICFKIAMILFGRKIMADRKFWIHSFLLNNTTYILENIVFY